MPSPSTTFDFDRGSSPHQLAAAVWSLCPDLSRKSRDRVAAMAQTMREVSAFDEGCTREHLLAADFTPAEIVAATPLACAALDHITGRLPAEAITAFPPADIAVLARFAGQQTSAAFARQ